ncbi:hypothetical protein [Methanopyrus sp.]
MIQYAILEYVLSAVVSIIIEKHVADPTTRRYVRQMAERIVREVLREARKRGVSLRDLFSSEGWVVDEIANRISGVLESIGVSSEGVRDSIVEKVSSKLKSPSTYLSSITETLSQTLSWGGETEKLPDHEFSEKVLDRLLEDAELFVYLASPWVSNPEDIVEEGVRSLKELPDKSLELYLLVAEGENSPRILREWAALGFEVREVEGRREGDLGIHCKVYANEKVALGASWNLTVKGLQRLRGMREVHTINPKTDGCDVCNANYELLTREFESRWSEAKQRFFRDRGREGSAILEVRWDGDRPTEVVIYRENGQRWYTVELGEHHEGFTFNGRAYRYVSEYRGFTPLVFEDDLETAIEVIYPFLGLKLRRVRPKDLKVVEQEVNWSDRAAEYARNFTGKLYDGALVVWGLDPDVDSGFYVFGGKLLAVKCKEEKEGLKIEFVKAVKPDDLPDWVSGFVDIGLLFERSSGEATPTLFVYG